MTPYHFCYVYVLKSVRYAKLYIGYTSDLRKRLVQHNRGDSKFTTRFKPWTLVYYEAFSNPAAARMRESNLKYNGNSMRELKKRIGIGPDAKVVRGFTLVETLAAITLLVLAIVSPMLLVERSLMSAYYARDQFTAFNLAQEAIEQVRQARDNNILKIAQGQSVDLFSNLPLADGRTPFKVDATNAANPISSCSSNPCELLQTDGTLYGYHAGWSNTNFRRSVVACYIHSDGTCTSAASDELRVTVTVSWQTAAIGTAPRSISLSEDLYRWIPDGTVG